jgi:hypothetical protein
MTVAAQATATAHGGVGSLLLAFWPRLNSIATALTHQKRDGLLFLHLNRQQPHTVGPVETLVLVPL